MAFRHGEEHPRARLTWHDVELMRALHDEGVPTLRIAKKFELPRRTVRNVVEYLVWTEPPVSLLIADSNLAFRNGV